MYTRYLLGRAEWSFELIVMTENPQCGMAFSLSNSMPQKKTTENDLDWQISCQTGFQLEDLSVSAVPQRCGIFLGLKMFTILCLLRYHFLCWTQY